MFWEAVWSGMETLTHWQTYVATLLYLLLNLVPLALVMAISHKFDPENGVLSALSALLLPLFQAFALVVFILSLAPIILGQSDTANWALPWQLLIQEPWKMLMLLGKLIVASYVLLLIRVQVLQTLIISSFALLLAMNSFPELSPSVELRVWPGLLFVIGLLIFSTVVGWFGIIFTAVLASILEVRFKIRGALLVIPFASSFGFIPLFIYAGWLAEQLK